MEGKQSLFEGKNITRYTANPQTPNNVKKFQAVRFAENLTKQSQGVAKSPAATKYIYFWPTQIKIMSAGFTGRVFKKNVCNQLQVIWANKKKKKHVCFVS